MDDIDDQDASERSPGSVAGASPVASTISFNDLRALKEATSPKTPPQTRYRRLARVAAGASSTSHPIICGGTTQRPGLM